MPYKVVVADNFHYMDPDEIYTLGEFATADLALEQCRRIVDEYLASDYEPGMSAAVLFFRYQSFGEDPIVVGGESDEIKFSGWDYAKTRCDEICSAK